MLYYELMSEACNSVHVDFNESVYEKFINYMNMLKEWNEKINLTAIIEEEDIIKKHFIDSIKIFQFEPVKQFNNVIDVGTGGGFPGIPMNILNPQTKVVLLDSLNKRIGFLNAVIEKLQLNNISAIHGRAEDFGNNSKYREMFDGAVSRAVANLAVLSEYCIPYVKVGGYFIALKGPNVDDEVLEGKNAISLLGGKIEDIIKVNVEESDLKHNLVIIKKVKHTPNIYPRKAGTASKKPLK